jgi:hypothetical protein
MDSQSEALAKREETQPTTQRGILTKEALAADTEQRKLLAEYVKGHMVEDTDYGVIPGTKKPTLLKPGAEKLTDLFRCTPKFALIDKTEDWDRGHGFFAYTFRVRLVQRDSGAVLAEGFGSANSREGRYRWRDASRKCPECGKGPIIKGRAEYGGGWLCWDKKGGCGFKWPDGAKEIEGQALGKVENEDVATLANTILKMAKKRALVDGAIALARCSDMFTQDVEDLADPSHADDSAPPPPPTQGKREAPREASAKVGKVAPSQSDTSVPKQEEAPTPNPKAAANRARSSRIWKRAQALGMTSVEDFKTWVKGSLGSMKESTAWTDTDFETLETELENAERQFQSLRP